MSTFNALCSDLVKLDSMLGSMQARGKVDAAVDEILESIISFVTQRERFWFNGDPSAKTFVTYHSWRNLRLIFSKMRNRFADAPLVHDNPLVADQAREVVPKILQVLPSLVAMEEEPTERETRPLSQRVRELRGLARKANMLPPHSEEFKEIDQTKLTVTLDGILNRVATLGEA